MHLRRLLQFVLISALAACGGSERGITTPNPELTDTRVVRISAYGEGNVQDTLGPISCEAHECERAYARGSQIVLTATPKVGWRFERWSGCDTVTDTKCTITVSADKLVAPVFLRDVETKFQNGVRDMAALDDASVLKYESGVLTLSKSAPVLVGLKVGDILLSQSGEGLARRVTKIVDIPGGATIVDTSDVAITDVVSQGSYYFNSKSKANATAADRGRRNALRIVPLHSGVKAQALWDGDFDTKGSIEVDVPIGSKKSIKGAIDFTLNLEGAIDIAFPGVLQEFRLVVNPTIEPHLSLVGDFGTVKGDKPLAKILGAPIALGPVVLVPEFLVKINYEGNVEVETNFVSSFTTTGSAGFTYLKGHGARKIWTAAADSAPFSPAGTGSISFDVMGTLQSGIKIWGVAGPNIQVGPYLHIEGSLSTADDCAKVEAEIGVRGKVGGEIKLASWELGEWEWVIAELPLIQLLDKPLSAGCNRPPMAPTGLAATPKGPESIQLNWTAPPLSESVVSYEVYRQGRMVTRVSETTYTDTGLVPGNEYCYDVRSRSVDSKVSIPGLPVCRRTGTADTQAPNPPVINMVKAESTTSARLSWAASTDNVGVVRYAVLVNDVVTDSTTASSLSVLRLAPGTNYCFKVRAYDAAGNASVDSARSCATTLSPDFAAWTLRLKCVDQSTYVVSTGIDIDLQAPNNVSSAGQALDYNGVQMSYHLFGGYDSATSIFQGRVNWTFANSVNVREDEFLLSLNTADTGDVAMNQIKVTGCNTTIRLLRN